MDLRPDVFWQKEVIQSNETQVILVWRNANLWNIKDPAKPEGVLLSLDAELLALSQQILWVGEDENKKAIMGLDISHLEEKDLPNFGESIEFINPLEMPQLLSTDIAPLVAYVRGIMHWHQQNVFCGKCGTKTMSHHFGHIRKCKSESCQRTVYPKIEPAVIVLLEHKEEGEKEPLCLLARHARLPQYWTTLAGFVEVGEQLEETVQREIYEEVGIKVTQIEYHDSQPWTFPSSLMLGFKAQAISKEINIDNDEIEEAKWFTAEELQTGITSGEIQIPGNFSIAHQMIQDWLKENYHAK